MIARWFPAEGTPATALADARRIALTHPGDDLLEVVVPGGRLKVREGVDVDRELVAELEELGGRVEVAL